MTDSARASKNTRSKVFVFWVWGGALALLFIYLIFQGLGIRINVTPSYPRGFWKFTKIESSLENGRFIAACPQNNIVVQMALDRRYLGRGSCGSMVPLIKQIVAGPHSKIEVNPRGVLVDGVLLPNSKAYAQDADGLSLPIYEGGTLHADEYLIMSDWNAGSFDGRYFGPVVRSDIIAFAAPIWVWE